MFCFNSNGHSCLNETTDCSCNCRGPPGLPRRDGTYELSYQFLRAATYNNNQVWVAARSDGDVKMKELETLLSTTSTSTSTSTPTSFKQKDSSCKTKIMNNFYSPEHSHHRRGCAFNVTQITFTF